MPRRRLAPLTELATHRICPGESFELVLAPGTKSGFKGVSPVDKKTWQARMTVDGKTRHVWTSSDPRECAFILARFKRYPCLLQSQLKESGEWSGRMTNEEMDKYCEHLSAACAQLDAIEHDFERMYGYRPGSEPSEGRAVKRVCPADRVPLSPV